MIMCKRNVLSLKKMAHQAELEKSKYRNWVRGGLAYKYLKHGLEGFADDVVLQEHRRILLNIKHKQGLSCNQCSVGSFKPKHTITGTGKCPRGLKNCSCLNRKKKPCPNNICDAIMEEILDCHDSHLSQPPTPNWKNSDIHKWCSDPWEVAKCFIHSPGYSSKSKASEIDAAGLLHVFINNISLHSHLSCKISVNGLDIFSKTLRRRNAIFHSSTMELEDNELNECIDDILAILEDEKELKQRPDAQRAVEKLKQLKFFNFVITANCESEVCRDAMVSITNRSEELKQMIQDAKDDIDTKKAEVSEAVDDETREALEDALKQLEKQNNSQLQAMQKANDLLCERLKNVEANIKLDFDLVKQRLTEMEGSVEKLDNTKLVHEKQLKYVKQKQALKSNLSPLKTHDSDIDVNELELKDIICDLDDCGGHAIDLPKHNQLRSTTLHHCSCLLGSVVNTKCLERVSILGSKGRSTTHGMCDHLSALLSQVVSLYELELKDIICDLDDCEGHVIDLPKHDKLRSITIHHCSYLLGSVVNSKCLERVSIIGSKGLSTPHGVCDHLSSIFSQAVYLYELELKDIICDCGGHAIDLPKHNQLRSITIHHCSFWLGYVVNAKYLVKVSILGSEGLSTPHGVFEHFSSLFSKAVSLYELELKNIICDLNDCGSHAIDLPKHDQLRSITIHHCSCMLGSVVNTKCLERVSILGSKGLSTSHGMCDNLLPFLSQTVSLYQLELKNIICDCDDCGGHAIDLPKHDELRSITIHHCSCLLGSLVNTKSLEKVSILGSKGLSTPHGMCEHLSSLFSKTVSLYELELKDIICDLDDCGGHAIDLPKHDQLRSITIHHCSCLFGSVINTKCLARVSIFGSEGRSTSHGICDNLSALLSQAESLYHLELKNIICDLDDCGGHAIDLPKHDQLRSVTIHHCSCLLGSVGNTKSLEKVSILGRKGLSTPHVMCEHLSSLFSQAVSLYQLELKDIICDLDDCGGHVIDLPKRDQLKSIEIHHCSYL